MYLLLIAYFFIFLFTLYSFVRDDYFFLKKNISIDQLFSLSFLLAAVSLFFARVFFVASHFSSKYLNPLVFLVFPYFPGLSLSAGILAGVVFLYLYTKRKKMPQGKIFDIVLLSFFLVVPFVFITNYFTLHDIQSLYRIFLVVGSIVLVPILFIIYKHAKLRDASTGFLTMLCVSTLFFLQNLFSQNMKGYLLTADEIVFMILFFASLGFLIKQEQIIKRKR